MDYVIAFIVGGFICVIGQLLLDKYKFTPAHVLSIFVIAGVVLEGFGLYDRFITFAGAGATVPITSFGHFLLQGAMVQTENHGYFGIMMGMFQLTSVIISSAILFSFIVALFFQPKG